MTRLTYADQKAIQTEAVNMVQHGLADVMAFIGEPVMPWPDDPLETWRAYVVALGDWRMCPHPAAHKSGEGGCYCDVCGFCWHYKVVREDDFGWCWDCGEERDIHKW